MRVLGPFLGALASGVTIFAAIVRLWWAKPKYRGEQGVTDVRGSMDDPMFYPVKSTKGPSWLATAAKWWLIIVLFGGTILVVVIAVVTIIQMST
jgi:hypothetical protein